MAADEKQRLRLRITGDGSFIGTHVDVLDKDRAVVGSLDIVRDIEYRITRSHRDGVEGAGRGVAKLTVFDVEAEVEHDVVLVGAEEAPSQTAQELAVQREELAARPLAPDADEWPASRMEDVDRPYTPAADPPPVDP